MKIAVTGTRGFPGVQGGVESHCEHLYAHLARLGCGITVFARKPYVAFKDTYIHNHVSLIAVGCPKNKFLEAFIHTFICVFKAKKLRTHILHIHGIGPSVFVPLARLMGMKVVVTTHGENYKHLKWGFFSKQFLKFCEAVGMITANSVIAISAPIAAAVEKRYRVQAVLIPNGVYMPEIPDTHTELDKYGIEKNRYILAVGRLVPEKGFDILIGAFNHGHFGDWKLVIAGKADHEDSYSGNLMIKGGGNRNIIFTGFVSGISLRELYANAGLFVISSYYEGLPIALLEAMSYGLSCIASDIPGNRNVELSEDRFFKPGDIVSLAEKIMVFIEKPINDDEKIRQIDMIKEKYNWNKIATETLRIYKKTACST